MTDLSITPDRECFLPSNLGQSQRAAPTSSQVTFVDGSPSELLANGVYSTEQAEAAAAILNVSDDRSRMHIIHGPTGFGKTRVGIGLVQNYLGLGYTVLWVAHKWSLLQQARDEMLSMVPIDRRALRRVGGNQESLDNLSRSTSGTVFFTTLQTWAKRQKANSLPQELLRSRKVLVIWDECHWAIDSPTGRLLLRHYIDGQGEKNNSLVVGLSATPKIGETTRAKVAWSIPYRSLIGSRVAYPIIKNVRTNAVWDPIVQNGLVSPTSLDQLATNRSRNQLIVEELLAGRQRGDYSRIVVFACNIAHANALEAEIKAGGASVCALHSRCGNPRSILSKFRNGEVDVLVTVNQFKEGDNVPDIDAVFIARPTTSLVSLQQMVGRACRLTPTKRYFWIVEFTDEIRRNADKFFHAVDIEKGEGRA